MKILVRGIVRHYDADGYEWFDLSVTPMSAPDICNDHNLHTEWTEDDSSILDVLPTFDRPTIYSIYLIVDIQYVSYQMEYGTEVDVVVEIIESQYRLARNFGELRMWYDEYIAPLKDNNIIRFREPGITCLH